MPIEFKSTSGSIELFIKGMAENFRTNAEDLRFALGNQKTRILDRTSRGLDANEDPFVPYSESGPYYWTPGKEAKNRKRSVSSYASKLNAKDQKTKSGLSIKFPSYGAFKRSLGRSVVDLLGPTAPHMLQAIILRVAGVDYTSDSFSRSTSSSPEAFEASLGIYNEEAERATGHNTGNGHAPQREFFAISPSDAAKISKDVEDSVFQRMKRFFN